METWTVEAVASAMIGSKIVLETKDGCRRTGTLTEVAWCDVLVNGNKVVWPRGLILNGDKTDEIPWERLAWVSSDAL